MTASSALIDQLSDLKAAGASPAAAAAAVVGGSPTVMAFSKGGAGTPAPAVQIQPGDLSLALATVFSDSLTAAELASIIHTNFPDLPALGVAEAVKAGLPATGAVEMYNALTGCGFAAADAQGAVNILYPTTVTIQANQPWQQTGVTVTGTQTTRLAFVSGSWTANPATGMCGPNGNTRFPAKNGYTLPGAYEGAMIGRVGNNPPFMVAASCIVPAGQSGMLSLCINDDLDRRYGVGLSDNVGTMTFSITTTVS